MLLLRRASAESCACDVFLCYNTGTGLSMMSVRPLRTPFLLEVLRFLVWSELPLCL